MGGGFPPDLGRKTGQRPQIFSALPAPDGPLLRLQAQATASLLRRGYPELMNFPVAIGSFLCFQFKSTFVW
jgi:hypothetical protein